MYRVFGHVSEMYIYVGVDQVRTDENKRVSAREGKKGRGREGGGG